MSSDHFEHHHVHHHARDEIHHAATMAGHAAGLAGHAEAAQSDLSARFESAGAITDLAILGNTAGNLSVALTDHYESLIERNAAQPGMSRP
jgi:hypothetical protein